MGMMCGETGSVQQQYRNNNIMHESMSALHTGTSTA